MRSYRNKGQFFIMFILSGFLAGILYANIVSGQYTTSRGIFNEYFLTQYAQTDVIEEEYIWYIIQVRVVPFLGVCILGCTKWKKLLAGLYIGWTGFLSGIVSVSAVMSLGIKGIFLCAAGVFPQIIFYAFTYIILLWYLYHYPEGRWNSKKSIVIGIAMTVGILLEVYVNPMLMRGVISLL